jgi:hypothetical protein
MTDMLDDPPVMTPPQRRREIAAILARGVLRLRQCRENTHDSRPSWTAEKAPESGQDCLDEGARRCVRRTFAQWPRCPHRWCCRPENRTRSRAVRGSAPPVRNLRHGGAGYRRRTGNTPGWARTARHWTKTRRRPGPSTSRRCPNPFRAGASTRYPHRAPATIRIVQAQPAHLRGG